MIGTSGRRVVMTLGFALCACFALAAHVAIVEGSRLPVAGAWLSLVPIIAFIVLLLRRAQRPLPVLLAVAAAIVVLWLGWPLFERHFQIVFLVEHAGANLALAIIFGRTLIAGRDPLCTRLARLVHETLPPAVERYTRQVTIAWTMFFALAFALSCFLYFAGFLGAWSLFANFLSPVFIAVMFVGEYLVRRLVLPTWERTGLLAGVRAFTRHFRAA